MNRNLVDRPPSERIHRTTTSASEFDLPRMGQSPTVVVHHPNKVECSNVVTQSESNS